MINSRSINYGFANHILKSNVSGNDICREKNLHACMNGMYHTGFTSQPVNPMYVITM